ncbi:hypothetical protein ACQ5ES_05595 [Pseudidiomarina sp. E22-M8]|uniref:hypothetical protein n=1 Tax=Pseudidiomarina sp. E22-M8 TaxID=3424768 RepID=UPI00403C9E74
MVASTSTNTKITLQHKLKRGLTSLVWRVNQQGQWFQGESATPSAAPKRRVACLVVSRGLYQEVWQSYAIRSYKGLRKVLTQKTHDPSKQHYIGPWHDGQRRVLTITLTDKGRALLAKALVVLPESLVLSAALNTGFYQVESGEHCYFLFNQENNWQTVVRSSMMRDSERAQLALGCPGATHVHQLTDADLGHSISRGVTKLGSHYWRQGWQKHTSVKGFAWQPALIVIAIVGSSYLALSSGYLVLERTWLKHKLEQITPEVSELLNLQSDLSRISTNLGALNQVYVNSATINQFWEIYAVFDTHNGSFTFMRGDGQQLSIGGEAENALELLKKLHSLPQVEKAAFASPVRGGSGKQRFRIDLTLQQGSRQ